MVKQNNEAYLKQTIFHNYRRKIAIINKHHKCLASNGSPSLEAGVSNETIQSQTAPLPNRCGNLLRNIYFY